MFKNRLYNFFNEGHYLQHIVIQFYYTDKSPKKQSEIEPKDRLRGFPHNNTCTSLSDYVISSNIQGDHYICFHIL